MKPILFNTEMVRAIQNGRKTATRRLIKHPYYIDKEDVCRKSGLAMHVGINATHGMPYPCNPYSVGDILYVRETWQNLSIIGKGFGYGYKADNKFTNIPWRPSIHMPKEAARIFLRVTDVRVEKLQDIRYEDCLAEGVQLTFLQQRDLAKRGLIAWNKFSVVWNGTIKKSDLPKYGWDANPWVWVIEFERTSKEEAYRT